MVMVCKNHVKMALESLDVPHVEICKLYKSPCIFCKQEANIKIFYSVPIYSKIRQINNIHRHESPKNHDSGTNVLQSVSSQLDA
jgi:hypothetical protein